MRPDFLVGDRGDPRRGLDRRPGAGRPRRPAGRDHRPGRAEDDDQRPQLGRPRLHGRPRGLALADVGQRASAARRRSSTPCAATLDLRLARGQGVSAQRRDRRRSSSGRAAGTSSSRACSSTASRSRPACSTSGCTCSTTAPRRSGGEAGPYFYLAKLESHHEARLWNEVFVHGQVALGIPRGSIRATVLIETHPRGLRDGRDPVRAARARGRPERRPLGLPVQRHQEAAHVGRSWPSRIASQLTMTVPFMRAYTELLVRTCHRRGAHAIGGMAAFIPNRRDPAVTEVALAQGPRRQGARIGRRVRRHLGRPPRPRAGRDGGLRSRPRRAAEPEGTAARGRRGGGRRAARPAGPGRRPSPRPGSGPTSGSPWPTSTRGCAGSERPPSTT